MPRGAPGGVRGGAGGAWGALLGRAGAGPPGTSGPGGGGGGGGPPRELVRPEGGGGAGGRWGLRAAAPAEKGAVLLSVPFGACLACRREGPELRGGDWGAGPWRWAAEGEAVPGLPWDLRLALGLVDLSERQAAQAAPGAGAGAGAEAGGTEDAGAFLGDYLRHWAPPVEELVLPFCLEEAELREFQHGALEEGALEQQRRLAGTFPELMPGPDGALPQPPPLAQGQPPALAPAPGGWWAAPGGPGPLQAGLALVRSRAFEQGDGSFAYVPFLDMANHSEDPSADYMTTREGNFVLFCRRDLAEGDAVTISYGAHTNQRMMAQYGFVPVGGNPHDRLDLLTDLQFGGGFRGFPLERVQAAVGDVPFLLALEGRDPRLTAAMKSLPLLAEEEGQAPGEAGQAAAGRESQWGEAQRDLARALQQRCLKELGSCPTSLEEDLALQEGGAAPLPSPGVEAALLYRIERKRLILRSAEVLGALASA